MAGTFYIYNIIKRMSDSDWYDNTLSWQPRNETINDFVFTSRKVATFKICDCNITESSADIKQAWILDLSKNKAKLNGTECKIEDIFFMDSFTREVVDEMFTKRGLPLLIKGKY